MRELRVFINSLDRDARGAEGVFYSRRSDGPYYRWHYEAALGSWRFSRVSPSSFTLRSFCVANWSAVPSALQARLVEHYLE